MIETNGPGGAENMLVHLAVGLRRRGIDTVPVIPAAPEPSWLEQRLKQEGFRPETVTVARAIDPSALRAIRRVVTRHDVDVVHSHEFTMGVYGRVATLGSGRPHVITMHGGTSFAKRARRRVALGWALRSSDARVAVSAATADYLALTCRVARQTVDVIPNGVEVRSGDRHAARTGLGLGNEVLVLAVGNLYPVKGHRLLIEAVAAMGELPVPWTLVIAGRGNEEAPLRTLIAAHHLESRVRLLGLRTDVPELLAAADVFVMPSLSEGLPLALLEAMMAGKAVVASAVGGIPSVIQAGTTGVLVPPNDSAALSRALTSLISDSAARRQLGGAARDDVAQRFGAGAMTDAYLALYESVRGSRVRHSRQQ